MAMAVSDGQLFVSTDRGTIHCFAPGVQGTNAPTVEAFSPPQWNVHPDDALASACEATAKAAVDFAGVKKGYCLILGVGTGRLAHEISKISDFRIIGVEEDLKKVELARAWIRTTGSYGKRIVVHHAKLDALPYTKYFANLIVSESLLASGQTLSSPGEVLRVLRPYGGAVVLATTDTGEKTALAEWGSELMPAWKVRKTGSLQIATARRAGLTGAGEWTHFYADSGNTACSGDTLKFGPMAVQWYGEPGPLRMVDRHRTTAAPLYKNGRLFVTGLDYIATVDAYNGTMLWERDVPHSARIKAFNNGGNMVAGDEHLYAATGAYCIEFDAQTGKEARRFSVAVDRSTENEWGYNRQYLAQPFRVH